MVKIASSVNGNMYNFNKQLSSIFGGELSKTGLLGEKSVGFDQSVWSFVFFLL